MDINIDLYVLCIPQERIFIFILNFIKTVNTSKLNHTAATVLSNLHILII